jgi:hypothetical protein
LQRWQYFGSILTKFDLSPRLITEARMQNAEGAYKKLVKPMVWAIKDALTTLAAAIPNYLEIF